MINATTGEVFDAQIFVAVLGASNYTYAEATRTQELQDWLQSHVRPLNTLAAYGFGYPHNLKAA